jgi:hypothetical protein
MDEQVPSVKLSGRFQTNSTGIERIMKFYDKVSIYHDTEVFIDCYDLLWLDGNLTALMNALEHKISHQNNIQLTTDFEFLSDKFGVLFRNGWLQHDQYSKEDIEQTTIPCTQFHPNESEQFFKYISDKLMCHRGMPKVETPLRLQIQNDLYEIYSNVFRHAQTQEPVFVCGQYYPQGRYFLFTMVDVGVGFLPPIRNFTGHEVVSDIDAIHWALKGNSISGEPLAGMGLQSVHDYCRTSGGVFHIFSGNAYWGTDMGRESDQSHTWMKYPLKGSLLNLKFNYR